MNTAELDTIKSRLTVFYATLGIKELYQFRFATEECCCDRAVLDELILYQYVLNFWQQYKDGTPVPDVNYITQDEFNTMIKRVKFLIL